MYLLLTLKFISPVYYGSTDGAVEHSWPPSPLRLFSALVNAAASRKDLAADRTTALLKWLEEQQPPAISCPPVEKMHEYVEYVQENCGDHTTYVKYEDYAKTKSAKPVTPVHMAGSQEVTYWYRIANPCPDVCLLDTLMGAIPYLGTGKDAVIGTASIEADTLKVQDEVVMLTPVDAATRRYTAQLRSPGVGTQTSLHERHEAQRVRIGPKGTFNPYIPGVRAEYSRYRYHRSSFEESVCLTFRLTSPEGKRLTLDPTARVCDIAAMTRHAVGLLFERSHFRGIGTFVHGHHVSREKLDPRFAYLVLPTLRSADGPVGGVNRVMITAPSCLSQQMDWLASYHELQLHRPQGGHEFSLQAISSGTKDWVRDQYVTTSTTWTTVTPVVLPGHDHTKGKVDPSKTAKLFGKVLHEAGFSEEDVKNTSIDFRAGAFISGVDSAKQFKVPKEFDNGVARYHVLVTFPRPVQGPIYLGRGRYRGLGTLVPFA